jgi:hypothetical protein
MSPSDPYENLEAAATSEGVPVAPSMGPLLESMRMPVERTLLDMRAPPRRELIASAPELR